MQAYEQFVSDLERLFARAKYDSRSYSDEIVAATNGLAKSELYRLVSVPIRRKHGAFFTDEVTAQFAARFLRREIGKGAVVCDPACGAGDLLLACTDYMSPSRDLRSTLHDWSRRLVGWDLEQSFVDACQLRLGLKCIERSQSSLHVSARDPDLFPRILCQDGLAPCPTLGKVDAVVMNPPYTTLRASKENTWGQGTINASALFLDRVVTQISPGTKIVAVLPDVLRSGTSYSKWRDQVSQEIEVTKTVTLQRFDPTTDVHVFVLVARKRKTKSRAQGNANWLSSRSKSKVEESSVGDLFDVSVGPVVEYREPNLGPWLLYLTARDLPMWTQVANDFKSRRFRGRRTKAPFVVVRRTSRPEDQHRAVATIIGGRAEYAVENHLMILEPKDGKLRTCRMLVDVLKRPETSTHLNHVIRCRHLTVSAIKSIPWMSFCDAT